MGELAKVSDRELMPPPATKPKKVVLEEDEYLAQMEAIIERDFFPDIPVMKRKLSELQVSGGLATDASPSGGVIPLETPIMMTGERGSELASNATPLADTPAVDATRALTLQTPQIGNVNSETGAKLTVGGGGVDVNDAPRKSLDQFLSQYTSEDNASFSCLQDESVKRKRMKCAHYLEDKNQPLLLEGGHKTDGYGTTGQQPDSLIPWKHVGKSKLYYDSSETGVAKYTEKELGQQVQGAPKEICHNNTRLPEPPQQADDSRIGYEMPGEEPSNKEKDYSYLATPLPVPGVNVAPIMTWGELGSTPVRLDSTPGFRIHDLSQRDKLGKELARSARKSLSKKKVGLSPVPLGMKTPRTLSEAGRKLASSLRVKTPGTDLQLRASYSRTPCSKSRLSTPLRTPVTKKVGSGKEEGDVEKGKLVGEGKPGRITDGLLDV